MDSENCERASTRIARGAPTTERQAPRIRLPAWLVYPTADSVEDLGSGSALLLPVLQPSRLRGEKQMSSKSRLASAALAAAAATLFIAGCASTGGGSATSADSGSLKVRCYGGNACKGQAECKTAMNACSGQNACKGQGYVTAASEQACVDILGRG
jgi:uncharacterized membrane protein